MTKLFKGVFVALITPFKDRDIDEESLRRHVNWLVTSGVSGLVPCGTTGEGATLEAQEYLRVVEIVVDETKGRCPIMAGAGSSSTAKAIELTRLVAEAGADATLQVTPYYNKPTQEGLYQHFNAIATAVKLPHILYNVPGRTGVNMLPETVIRLAKVDNIVGVKEASGDLKQIEAIVNDTAPKFCTFSGNDDQNLEIYEIGGCGAISVTANIAPREVSDVWSLFEAGERARAGEKQSYLAELNRAMFLETNPIPVKTSLAMMNRCREEFRLPLTPIATENRDRLQKVLKKYGLLG